MEFGPVQKKFFGALQGAYSVLTANEIEKSQITLTDAEAEIAINFYGFENIQKGNVTDDREKASQDFYLHGTEEVVNLNLVYPKYPKTELRLYLRAGFKPKANSIWFMYVKNGHLYIGSMPANIWQNIGREDYEDEEYQAISNLPIEMLEESQEVQWSTVSERTTVKRNPKLAACRFKISDYQCEFDAKHNLFISRSSSRPYIEAHHLIPIGYQKEFKEPLDNLLNIFSLCPYCHSAIHHAEIGFTFNLITRLVDIRREVLKHYNLNYDDILKFYNCEKIA